eukprot:gene61796-biopygen28281
MNYEARKTALFAFFADCTEPNIFYRIHHGAAGDVMMRLIDDSSLNIKVVVRLIESEKTDPFANATLLTADDGGTAADRNGRGQSSAHGEEYAELSYVLPLIVSAIGQLGLKIPISAVVPGRILHMFAVTKTNLLRLKQIFVRYVSHEIRSPLNVVHV